MNRAERRAKGIKIPPPRMKHMPERDYNMAIDKAYRMGWDNAFEKASNLAVAYMLAVPLLVLHDHFNEIRLKEYKGIPRVEHFFDLCTDIFDDYNTGDDTLTRLMADVEKKTGFDISSRVFVEKEKKK